MAMEIVIVMSSPLPSMFWTGGELWTYVSVGGAAAEKLYWKFDTKVLCRLLRNMKPAAAMKVEIPVVVPETLLRDFRQLVAPELQVLPIAWFCHLRSGARGQRERGVVGPHTGVLLAPVQGSQLAHHDAP